MDLPWEVYTDYIGNLQFGCDLKFRSRSSLQLGCLLYPSPKGPGPALLARPPAASEQAASREIEAYFGPIVLYEPY